METNLYFKATLGKTAGIITVAVTVLFAGIIMLPFFLLPDTSSSILFVISAIILLTYLLAYLFRPTGYRLTGTQFIICRPLKNVIFELNEIRSVNIIDPNEINWSLRIFGSGGLFGYFGKFANRKFGAMTWFATRRNNTILIKTTSHQKIIITPDDPGLFAAQFNK